jgi:restriction system protein
MANTRQRRIRISAVPWWGWLTAGGIAWLLGQLLLGLAPAPKGSIAHIAIAALFKGVGFFLASIGPLIGVLLAIVSALTKLTASREGEELPRIEPHMGGDRSAPSAQKADADLYEHWKAAGTAQESPAIDTTSWNMALLKALEWKRLEQLSAVYFRTLKFRVEESGPGPDGGIDLRLYTDATPTPGVLVQCKAWNSWKVGVKEMRELYGVMAAEGVSEGIYVTTNSFSKDAVEFARGKSIALIDGEDLLRKLLSLPAEDQAHILSEITSGDFVTPTCPSCGIKMVTRAAQGSSEAFWGCVRFPKCRSTLQIRRSPVKA